MLEHGPKVFHGHLMKHLRGNIKSSVHEKGADVLSHLRLVGTIAEIAGVPLRCLARWLCYSLSSLPHGASSVVTKIVESMMSVIARVNSHHSPFKHMIVEETVGAGEGKFNSVSLTTNITISL